MPIYDGYNSCETIVLWDIEDCPIPLGLDSVAVKKNIERALKKKGYHGNVTIYPYGDSAFLKDDFDGFPISYMSENRDSRRKIMLAKFYCCAIDNKFTPTNLMLIMGDISKHMGFVMAVHSLKSQGYFNVLLAQPLKVSGLLQDAISTEWIWSSLATGDAAT